jgi:hypothetical protein
MIVCLYVCTGTHVQLRTQSKPGSLNICELRFSCKAQLYVQQSLTFILPGWVYKFWCMVYEKCIILTEEDKKS